jgi:hypothetical protein
VITVCDMGPLHYLVLIGCDHILPQIFDRVITARVVIESLWTLQLLDEAAELGLIDDLTQRLEFLEARTSFYVGEKVRAVIDGMKKRDTERKLANDQQSRKQNPDE